MYTTKMKKGTKHTAETIAKMSAALKGRKLSPEWRAKISAAEKGKKKSAETKARMSIAAKHRKPPTVETRAKMSEGKKGKKVSAKTRDRLIKLRKGTKHTAETKAKISAAQKGRPGRKHSEKEKAEMSARLKGNPCPQFQTPEATQKRRNMWILAWMKNGNISKGQRRLYQILLSMGIPFIPEKFFRLKMGRAFIDAFLPLQNMAIEYDGHHRHRTPKGRAKDKDRDAQMLDLHDVTTLRIGRNEIFSEHALTKIGRALDKAFEVASA